LRWPLTASYRSRIASRSRKQYRKTDMAPMSRAWVPSQTRWLLIRVSSVSRTRITWARSGTTPPSAFSMAREGDPERVVPLPLVPVGRRPHLGDRGDRLALIHLDLEPQPAPVLDRVHVVHHLEARRALGKHQAVHARHVRQEIEGQVRIVPEEPARAHEVLRAEDRRALVSPELHVHQRLGELLPQALQHDALSRLCLFPFFRSLTLSLIHAFYSHPRHPAPCLPVSPSVVPLLLCGGFPVPVAVPVGSSRLSALGSQSHSRPPFFQT